MTDLHDLLHAEADRLEIPAPTPASVLGRGRALRRRRRTTSGLATLAAVAVIGGGALVAVTGGGGGTSTAPDPVAQPTVTPDMGAVFSIEDRLFYADGQQSASIADPAIKSLYYTSAGVLVRSGDNDASDGGGPQRFQLVTPDGTVHPVGVVTEEDVPGVDPTEPYLAYSVVVDGTVEVVVQDVATDTEVARVPVPGDFTWGGWSAPPLALVGDDVYVGSDDVERVVDWRTGVVTTTSSVGPGYISVDGERTARTAFQMDGDTDGPPTVIDVATGRVLLTGPEVSGGSFDLSPDGRYAGVSVPDGIEVYDIDAGTHVTIDGRSSGLDPTYGWSSTDEPFSLAGSTLTTCSPTTGQCASAKLSQLPDAGPAISMTIACPEPALPALGCPPTGAPTPTSTYDDLRLGGVTYES